MQIVLYFEFDVQLPSLPAFALLYHCHCHCQIQMNIHKSQIVRDIHVNSTPRAEMEHCSWLTDQLEDLSTYHWVVVEPASEQTVSLCILGSLSRQAIEACRDFRLLCWPDLDKLRKSFWGILINCILK
uniref:Uncharacterized protein n=1 Tax=Cacopsylla melanoneura TaxID=428564 RepID=A0A8D8QBK7_9HEMI